MPRFLHYIFAILIAVLLIGGPLGYHWHCRAQIRNFHVVTDRVLFRSGQMSLDGLKRVVHDFGIRTVVTLRDSVSNNDPPPDLTEEEYCKKEEINYYRISPRNWWSADGSVPAEEGMRQFRAVMDDPKNYPVLIHCFAGIHRTGAFCAVYRMEYQHWTNSQAIEEMRRCGYHNIDDEWDLLGYLEQYTPRWARVGNRE